MTIWWRQNNSSHHVLLTSVPRLTLHTTQCTTWRRRAGSELWTILTKKGCNYKTHGHNPQSSKSKGLWVWSPIYSTASGTAPNGSHTMFKMLTCNQILLLTRACCPGIIQEELLLETSSWFNTVNGHGTLQGSPNSLLQYRKHWNTSPPREAQRTSTHQEGL